MRDDSTFPDALPALAVGHHRDPRDGGCLMEWVSLLAGERWSDHPACTHPLLAHLARSVNDRMGDASRGALMHLLPMLTGARSDDRSWSLEIAAVTVRHALRRAGAQDARELAVALLTVDRLLGPTDGRTPAERRATTTEALATVPAAAAWAEEFTRAMGPPRHVRGLTRGMVDASLTTVSAASDADDALVAMLTDAVLTCQDLAVVGRLPGGPERSDRTAVAARAIHGGRSGLSPAAVCRCWSDPDVRAPDVGPAAVASARCPPIAVAGAARSQRRVAAHPRPRPLPSDEWPTMGDWLRDRLPEHVDVAEMLAGERFVDEDGRPVREDDPYAPHRFVWFHRDLRDEPEVTAPIHVVHRDERLVVVDKPAFLSSIPRGRHVMQSVVVRLRAELGLPDLSPLHRLDRVTSGPAHARDRAAVARAVPDAVRAPRGGQDVLGAGAAARRPDVPGRRPQPPPQGARLLAGGGGAGRAGQRGDARRARVGGRRPRRSTG